MDKIKELEQKIKDGDTSAYFELGKFYDGKSDYKKAEECYLKAIEVDPENTEIYKYIAYCCFEQEEYNKAEGWYLKVIEVDPDYQTYAYTNIGVCYHQQDKYDKAIKYYLKAVEVDPENALAYRNLGFCYFDQKKYSKAEECYLKAIEVDPENADAFFKLGNCYLDQHKYENAEENYLMAINIDPQDTSFYNNLGICYFDQGKYDKVEECYLKSIGINSKDAIAYNNLGLCYYEKKEYDKAKEHYMKAIEADTEFADPYFNLGNYYLDQCLYEKAKENFLKTIELNPKHSSAFNNLGLCYKELEQYNKAEECYLKSIGINSKDAYPHYNIGVLYSEKIYNIDKAFKSIKKATELGFSNAYRYLAAFYYDKKISFKDAVKYLKKAIKDDNQKAYIELGQLYSGKENFNKNYALKYYQLAKENGFDCDYEILQLLDDSKSSFINQLHELSKIDNYENAVVNFVKEIIGDNYGKLLNASIDSINRCIYEYVNETRASIFAKNDYSSSILSLAKAIENELDEHLGKPLVKYIKDKGLENSAVGQSVMSRKKSRTLGEYPLEFKKETRVFDKIHLNALQKCFKDDLFVGVNGDIHLTNYITNLVKEVKTFSEKRNDAAHKKQISKETCEKWLDKMIGSGHMFQNFLHKLK